MKHFESYLQRYIGIFANAVECYAGGLIMFSLPLLSQDIYAGQADHQTITNNFLLYGLSLWSYPLGSLMFGWLGDYYGRRPALLLCNSIMLIALATLVCCPKQVSSTGAWVFAALSLYHMGSGSEMSGGALFSLENGPQNQQGRISGYICTFSVFGILLASGSLSLLQVTAQTYWIAYYIAIGLMVMVLVGVFFAHEPPLYVKDKETVGWNVGLKPLFTCFMVASVFGVGYYVPFVFLPQVVTLLTPLTLEATSHFSTLGLGIYMFSLFGAGLIADRVGIVRLMQYACLGLTLACPVAFALAWSGALSAYLLAQGLLAIAAGVFISPSHALMADLFPPHSRYRVISLTFALAFTIVGGTTPLVLDWLYKATGSLWILSGWIALWALGTYGALGWKSQKLSFRT